MATATTLTPTEVIDRVRAARHGRTASSGRAARAGPGVGAAAPVPGQRDTGALGRGRPARRRPGPAGRTGAPWVAEFAPVDLAAALGITHDAGRQLIADALELAYRLPRLWKLVLAGEVPVWRARLIARETTDLVRRGGAFADRLIAATPRQDRSGPGRPAGPGGPAVLRPRPRPRRRGRSPRQARCLAAPRQRPGHHRRHDDPGHPRRAALRPDRHPHRRRPQRARRHRGPRGPPRTRGRDPRRPPARPGPARPAATAQHPAAAPGGAANLYVHLTPADLAADRTDGHRGRLDREARRRHHPAAHRLAHPVRGSRHQDHPPPRPRPQLTTGPWTSTTHPKRCANRGPARRPLRLPRLPPRLPGLRPRPHHRVPPHGRRRTTGPNPARQSRTAVPDPPPGEDPHRLALQTPRRRQLHVDRTHRAPVPRHAPLSRRAPPVASDRLAPLGLLDHLWSPASPHARSTSTRLVDGAERCEPSRSHYLRLLDRLR